MRQGRDAEEKWVIRIDASRIFLQHDHRQERLSVCFLLLLRCHTDFGVSVHGDSNSVVHAMSMVEP